MSKTEFKAELFARGRGICRGTTFSGDLFGRTHEFPFSDHQIRVGLPAVEFEAGTDRPSEKWSRTVHFRSGYVDNPTPARSTYELDYLSVEIDFQEPVRIPSELLDHEAVRKSPELAKRAPHLDKLAVQYDGLLASAWHQWMRVARWATDQHTIGLPDWTTDGSADLEMPRIHEKRTGYGVWASTGIVRWGRSASINAKQWEHIGDVLSRELTPPIWFEYLVEARFRLASQDYSGCVLSSVIACETLARAVYMRLVGAPANAAAAELVNRTAAQAIIGRWKELTGLKAEGKLHKIFDIRNSLVHSGRTDSVDAKIALDTLQTARNFVESGDEWWFAEHSEPNPRVAESG